MKSKKAAPLGIKRRQVLAGATAAAGTLAATRVLGLHHLGPDPMSLVGQATPTGSPTPDLSTHDWTSPLSREDAQVAQLLRRATFGHTSAQLAAAVKDGYKRTVDRLIETPAQQPKELANAENASQDQPIPPVMLQTWWLDQMLTTTTPFAERMTYFWHGHFTSDFRKVTPQTPYIYWQNLTWRRMALGDLRTMLMQVTTDPGMLRYLDLGQSTGKSPNENYSRELMELFTMGVGTFTEDDVRNGAKALAGWREPITPAIAAYLTKRAQERGAKNFVAPTPDTVKTGVFVPQRAFAGQVKLLGDTRQWDTQAVIDKILTQDSVAPYLVTKIVRDFVMQDPPDAYVKRIADGFRRTKYDVKTLMRDVFLSPELRQPVSYRSLVKSPTEYMVSVARALEAPQLARGIALAGSGMGQALFDPPEVGGWPTNASWISTNNVLTRVNFVIQALSGMQKVPAFGNAHETYLDSVVSPKTAELLNSAQDDSTRWLILLGSPEFQLK